LNFIAVISSGPIQAERYVELAGTVGKDLNATEKFRKSYAERGQISARKYMHPEF
jgi:hypothetical protein